MLPAISIMPTILSAHNSMSNNKIEERKIDERERKEWECEKCKETRHIFPHHKMRYFAMYFVAIFRVFFVCMCRLLRWSETGMSTRYEVARITGSLFLALYSWECWTCTLYWMSSNVVELLCAFCLPACVCALFCHPTKNLVGLIFRFLVFSILSFVCSFVSFLSSSFISGTCGW